MCLEKLFLCEFHADNFYLGITAAVANGRRHGHPWREEEWPRVCVEYNPKGKTLSWRKNCILSSEKMSTLGQICLGDKKKRKAVPGVVSVCLPVKWMWSKELEMQAKPVTDLFNLSPRTVVLIPSTLPDHDPFHFLFRPSASSLFVMVL